jgi:hypothetical protein
MTAKTQDVIKQTEGPRRLDPVVAQVSVVLVLLFAASVVLFWQIGAFDVDEQGSNAQVLAAVLGLVGVLVTAALTFIGVLLKHSIDARTLQQTAETEGRLRLETSIRAVELLTEDGKPALPTRQAGALFVLANLNQLDFAYALLGQVWTKREISPGAAVWVVNHLLVHGDKSLQVEAAVLLDANADTLATSAGYEYPDCVNLAWSNDLPAGAREYLVSALAKALVSQPLVDWDDESLNAMVVQLDLVRRIDKTPYIANGAIVCLDALLEVRQMPAGILLNAPDGGIPVDDLVAEVKAAVPLIGDALTSLLDDLATRIRTEWGVPASGGA